MHDVIFTDPEEEEYFALKEAEQKQQAAEAQGCDAKSQESEGGV